MSPAEPSTSRTRRASPSGAPICARFGCSSGSDCPQIARTLDGQASVGMELAAKPGHPAAGTPLRARHVRSERMSKNKGAMTVAEAGRKGGATTAQRHGPEFYEQIGKKGGRTTAQRHGADFYEQIGKQGGQKVKELYGPRFYGRIGKIGGDAVSEKYGHEHFEEIGKKGGQKVAELIARGRQAS